MVPFWEGLERHKPIELLAQRDAETVSRWLSQHPTIEIISRDRSTEYIRAITLTLPGVIQVADRWHLIKNLREALERTTGAIYSQLIKSYKADVAPVSWSIQSRVWSSILITKGKL
jgi:transposase